MLKPLNISKWIGLLCACCTLIACANQSSTILSDQSSLDIVYGHKHDLNALVDKLANPLIESGMDAGIVVAILDEDGHKYTFGYGKRSLNSNMPPDGKTIFALGSLTKAFTTLLLYDLVKDGTLKYDDTVGDILPNEKDFSPAAKRITLEQLANHSSGLHREPMDLAMATSLINYSFTGENIYRHMDKDEMYNYLKSFNPDPKSIGKYVYSNIGMALLGHLIEVRTGKSLATLMEQRFFVPLGMHDTSYIISSKKLSRLADGHVGDSPFFVVRNTPIPPWDTFDIMRGMAGLYSTSDDLLKFAQYRIRLHDVPIIKEPVDTGFLELGHEKYQYVSLGWSVDEFNDGKTEIIFKPGMIAGYSAYMGIIQKTGIAVIVLCNTFNWEEYIGHNILLTLSRNSTKGKTAQ